MQSISSVGGGHVGGGRRWGRIRDAVDYSGLSRTSLYKLAAVHEGLFRKHGASTIVDFVILDRILEATPPAEISAPV
jgi:hypothetical protein